MLRTLVKINFLSLLSHMFRSKKNKKMSKGALVGFSVLWIYVFGIFGAMFTLFFSSMCEPFHAIELDWFYFAMAGLTATALMFVGSIFAAQSQLYDAKDNELLLSLPIPPKNIVASRMLMLLAINFVFEILVCVPAAVIYGIKVGFSVPGLISLILLLVALPFFALCLSFLAGFIIQLISSRMRNKSIITMVLSVGFLLAYFYFYSQISSYMQLIITQGKELASSLSQIAPAYWFGNAISQGNLSDMVYTLLFCLIPFGIVYYIISKSFIRIATMKKGAAKIVYRAKSLKQSSQFTAMLKKELKHFTSSPMYMMNGAIGLLFLVIGAVFLIFNKSYITNLTSQAPMLISFVPAGLIALICLCNSMVIISSPSISLEGKNLWISQSIPVDYSTIIMAKAWTHITISLPPTIIASIAMLFVVDFTPIMLISLFVLPIAYCVFCSFFGLVMNMLFPKFDWISETAAIKQSFSSIAAMFGSAGVLVIPVVLYIALLSSIVSVEMFTVILTLFFFAVTFLLYRLMMTWGKKKFASL